MARKAAKDVQPDDIDNMSDDEVAELVGSMSEDAEDIETKSEPTPEHGPEEPGGDEQAKAEPEPQDDDHGDDQDEPQNKTDKVDFKRYDYERNRRKAAEEAREKEREAARKEREEWQRRFDALLKSSEQKAEEKPQEDAIPDWSQDPVAAGQWTQEQLIAWMNEQAEQRRQQEEARQQAEWQQQLLSEAKVEFDQASEADPTVRAAYDALVESFQNELRLYNVPQHQIQQELHKLETQHIAYARQNRIPVADYLKGLATSRGWRPQATQQQPTQEQQKANPDAAREKAKSLSNGGGSPGVSDTLTAEQILSMKDDEFDAFIAKHGSVSAYLEKA